MIYLSINIETTGLNERNNQMLEFGAIIEDSNKLLSFEDAPKFRAILPYQELTGSPFALNMNKELIEIISKYYSFVDKTKQSEFARENNIIHPENLPLAFFNFLDDNGLSDLQIPVAGKNFEDFDKKFIDKIFVVYETFYHRRFIDPTTSFIDFNKDKHSPSLLECKKRAGLSSVVSHTALGDAWDMIELLRKKY